eukprot:1157697-Pelagomonas_calceolata.AAC.12
MFNNAMVVVVRLLGLEQRLPLLHVSAPVSNSPCATKGACHGCGSEAAGIGAAPASAACQCWDDSFDALPKARAMVVVEELRGLGQRPPLVHLSAVMRPCVCRGECA